MSSGADASRSRFKVQKFNVRLNSVYRTESLALNIEPPSGDYRWFHRRVTWNRRHARARLAVDLAIARAQ